MLTLKQIATIRSDFTTKFGVPRQSGLCDANISHVVFEKEYSNPDSVRGLEGFSHIWLIWGFSLLEKHEDFSPTVRPPKLGGNKRVGVFATRSPNRPNPIGLSCVGLKEIIMKGGVLTLTVTGADLVDGTPIYDIKPYLPVSDKISDAVGGFTEETQKVRLYVDFPDFLLKKIPEDKREGLIEALSLDPRPGYHDDCERVYGFSFSGKNVRFKVDGETVTVVDVE